LIIAEVICFACLDYGVDAGKDYAMRAPDCQCGVFGDRFRFKKNLVNAQNRRLLKFDIFDADDGDDGTNLALDSFLDFLINHGSKGISTYVIGHNAGRFDYHILLERIYALQLQPKMIMNGNFFGEKRLKLLYTFRLENLQCSPLRLQSKGGDLQRQFELHHRLPLFNVQHI
jgi:hypothetical protein